MVPIRESLPAAETGVAVQQWVYGALRYLILNITHNSKELVVQAFLCRRASQNTEYSVFGQGGTGGLIATERRH
jgi:hypothetical protein